MFLGTTGECSFIEMFEFASDLGFGISEEIVRRSCLCPVELRRPLVVVDLTTGPNLKRLSPQADNRICDGSHDVSQRWSAAFWSHPATVDGILYRARNAPELFSVALFDRVEDQLVTDCNRNLLQDDLALANLLDYFDCPLMP
jgi:hypothetical protein